MMSSGGPLRVMESRISIQRRMHASWFYALDTGIVLGLTPHTGTHSHTLFVCMGEK
jgi:hypothetical protein